MSQLIDIPKGGDKSKALRFISALSDACGWRIEVKRLVRTRSTDQNALLWKLYQNILDYTALDLSGWTKDDLHEYLLGEHFGWELLQGFGRKRMRPIKRSSKLSTVEFSAYVEFVYQFAAEHGIYLESAA